VPARKIEPLGKQNTGEEISSITDNLNFEGSALGGFSMNNILGLSSVDSRQDSLQDQLVDTNAPESVPDNNSTSREYGLLQNPPLSTFDKIWGPPIEEDCLGPHETPFSEDEFIIHRPQMQAS
jgi:hypothetical protein